MFNKYKFNIIFSNSHYLFEQKKSEITFVWEDNLVLLIRANMIKDEAF
jgi:hypothetical protein